MALFFLTVLSTAGAWLVVVRRTSFTFLLPLWLALLAALALAGFFANPLRLPPFLLLALASVTYLAFHLRDNVPIHWLIAFQSFRIPVEIFLHDGYRAGFVPVQMTWEGQNFDILTGLTALPIAWLAARGRLPLWAMKLWTFAGFALLLNIMSVAILSLPTPFRQFHNEPANRFVLQFPYVWLPAVLVPAAWFGHMALLRRLAK